MGQLDGKTALVTGGASGIGLGVARLFAREGARVAVLDLDLERAQAAVRTIEAETGAKTIALAADVADEAAVTAAMEGCRAELGAVDILVTCAGMDDTGLLEEMPVAQFDRMIAVHLRGTFLAIRAVLPAMKRRRWGRIIAVSSQLAHKGAATMAHYCAAKAGVMGLVKALAYEVGPFGITVNAVNPGPIDTPLLKALPDDWRAGKLAELPIGRFGTVEEVAPTFLLLASDAGSYYLGATLNMNGGDYMI